MNKNNKDKAFVYINTLAAHCIDEGILKKFLNKKIGNKNWSAMSDILIPMSLRDEMLSDDFFHGVATAQFTAIQGGGTFINPLLAGLKVDLELWNGIIHFKPDFYQSITYIDVPYSLYEMVDDAPVEEDEYDMVSDNIKTLVRDLEEEFYVLDKTLH